MSLDFTTMMPLGNLLFAFWESTLPGKIIVVLLSFSSIAAWTVMVSKFLEVHRAKAAADYFLNDFHQQLHPVSLFIKRRRYPETPLNVVYEAGCQALGTELKAKGIDPESFFRGNKEAQVNLDLNMQQFEHVRTAVERKVADQALELENNMGLLATAVSAAPFIGLLGTVWGVMDAFSGMAQAGSATLSAVAPGVAGALLTTVVGLLVALPSAIGYNLLTSRIRRLSVQMDNFAQEWNTALQRTFMMDE